MGEIVIFFTEIIEFGKNIIDLLLIFTLLKPFKIKLVCKVLVNFRLDVKSEI